MRFKRCNPRRGPDREWHFCRSFTGKAILSHPVGNVNTFFAFSEQYTLSHFCYLFPWSPYVPKWGNGTLRPIPGVVLALRCPVPPELYYVASSPTYKKPSQNALISTYFYSFITHFPTLFQVFVIFFNQNGWLVKLHNKAMSLLCKITAFLCLKTGCLLWQIRKDVL